MEFCFNTLCPPCTKATTNFFSLLKKGSFLSFNHHDAPAKDNENYLILYHIKNLKFFIYTSALKPSQVAFQWLWLYYPIQQIPAYLFYTLIYSFLHLFVLSLPMQIIFPCIKILLCHPYLQYYFSINLCSAAFSLPTL